MYIINIQLDRSQQFGDDKLAQHRAWFTRHFEAGDFLIVGPSKTHPMSGVVIAQAKSREALDKILAEDAFYPDGASYDVNEIAAHMVADNITDYRE
ncbi:YciI family protein [Limosilactobacillus sp.]|jgi:uncharacterized protein YciI|uniref:YciI family protein n=1 Tax=Limosilactobacillus sp. TaxID=2773925 RepID=UPI0025B9B980|nr:YciI family protein [Limosilactobacillus sp.]MCH3922049.1 YciI family protein [Limosilactobacillus sp.]MCH3928820.1 YciI family protein [Limosilactobacillus sp.]